MLQGDFMGQGAPPISQAPVETQDTSGAGGPPCKFNQIPKNDKTGDPSRCVIFSPVYYYIYHRRGLVISKFAAGSP